MGFCDAPIERKLHSDASQFGVKSALGSLRYSKYLPIDCLLIHYRFFFFLFAKIAFQLSLYAFETGFWPSPRL